MTFQFATHGGWESEKVNAKMERHRRGIYINSGEISFVLFCFFRDISEADKLRLLS